MAPPRRTDIDDLLRMGGVSLALHKKAALDEIQERLAHCEKAEKRPTVSSPNVSVTSSGETSSSLESKLNPYYSLIWTKIKRPGPSLRIFSKKGLTWRPLSS